MTLVLEDLVVYYCQEEIFAVFDHHDSGSEVLVILTLVVTLVRFLIRHGADVNAEDVQHKTALHYAIQVRGYTVLSNTSQ